MDRSNLPLSGITVLDLSHVYAGPYATLLLALAGARVIKVEPPGGEHLRKRASVGGPRFAFAMMNSNKESITLNLKDPRGADLLRQLASKADVLVENFRPGVLDRLGLGESSLLEENPHLIYAHSSGYGSSGPYRDYAAMDLSVQAMSGVLAVTGFPDAPPVKAGNAVSDFSAGTHLYGAIMTALFERTRTGMGTYVEVSMMESTFASLMSNLGGFYSGADPDLRTGNRHGGLSVVPYNVYPTEDGYIAIICEGDNHWARLTQVMGRPELAKDPRYSGTTARVERIDEVDAIVTEWAISYGKEALFELLHAAGVPAAPVRNLSEVTTDKHLQDRNFLQPLEHPELGEITGMGSPLRIGHESPSKLSPSRSLGADTRSILAEWLDLKSEDFSTLDREGVFG